MILTVKLKLTSQFLGELHPDHLGVRRFKKLNGKVFVNVSAWREQFRAAARHTLLDINVEAITPPASYESASVHLFNRHFSGVKTQMFESFRKGTVLTMDFLVDAHQRKCPQPAEFETLLAFVGEHLGLSQFGNKFGFGRFTVVSIEIKDYAVKESKILNAGPL